MPSREIEGFKRKRPPMYIGPPLLIKWCYLMMGLERVNGRRIDELEKQAAVLDAFYKIGLFCGAIRKKHNLIYGDLKSEHFLLDRKRLYVVDFGETRFEDLESASASDIVNSAAYREWLFGTCAAPLEKTTREFLAGYDAGLSGKG